jgi:alpha-ketoglutarate-dependent taurine dioxygenase
MKDIEPDISSFKAAWNAKRKSTTPRATSLSQAAMVRCDYFDADKKLPLVLRPAVDGIALPIWASNNKDFIQAKLLEHGGLLFRGFDLSSQAAFERFLSSMPLKLMHYIEGATPRTEIGDKVYTSTEYPPDQSIALHNELTYVITWPMKIFFFCIQPAERGGETPIADVRRVLRHIPQKILDRFNDKGWMLVRNYGDGLSLSWESAFRTKDRAVVEQYCREAKINYEWKDERRLKTSQVRAVVAKHHQTGEAVWFNHVAFWHVSSLDPRVLESMLSIFKVEDLPYNTYYGDGTPIEDSVVEELCEAYRKETITFPWQKGDLLMLDNMLVAHGRSSYSGARKILVAMADAFTNQNIE